MSMIIYQLTSFLFAQDLEDDTIHNMSSLTLKNKTKTINYEKNLRKLLGWEDFKTTALKKYFGYLKGSAKKSGVVYQREIRKEWERKSAK